MKIERKEIFNSLKESINNYEQIILIPHNEIDLDALGASLGLYMIFSKYKKNVIINFEENEPEFGVSRAMQKIKELNLNINFSKKYILICFNPY